MSKLANILDAIVPANIAGLPIYQPGKPLDEVERELGIRGAIKLASNESVTGPSPLAVEAIRSHLAGIAEYPDGDAFKLRRALGEYFDLDPRQFVFGAGCNEVIHLAVRALCRPGIDQVVTHEHAFISYKLAALGHGAPFIATPTTKALGCDVDALLAAVTDSTRVVFVANPNNPTGSHLSPAELERIVRSLPEHVLLVVDEAYFEYASRTGQPYASSLALRGERELLLTLRTFSKIYGLAGLRVGYGVGPVELIEVISRTRRPFNVNSLAQAAATASLADTAHVEHAAAVAISGVARLASGAGALGVTAYPSLGNFVLIDVGRSAQGVYDGLLRRGVIVRPMAAWGLPQCIRVSSGTAEQNDKALAALAEVLADE